MSNLKKIVILRRMRMVDIAKKAGMKYKTVNRQCITGIKTTRVAKRYAEVLKCSPFELLD